MKIDLEKVFISVFFIVILSISIGTLWGHNLKHDFPYAYLASDTFQHQVRTESIKLMGNYRYEAPYIVAGNTDNVGFYPPIIYHLGVIFSYVSGLETYDGAYFLVFLFSFFSAIIVYFLVRKFNRNIAIVSLPISLLIFSRAPYIGFTWGGWPSLVSQFFLIFFFWCLTKIDLKNSHLLIGLAISGTALTHTSETIFAIIFLAIFLSYKLATKELNKSTIMTLAKSFMLFFIVSFYYLVIFYFTWSKMQPFVLSVIKDWGTSPVFTLLSFGFLSIFLLLGIIFLLIQKKKNAHILLLMGFFSLIFGLSNYFGFGIRAFQLRMFWPIYLCFFIGSGIYYLARLFIKKWSIAYSLVISVALLFILNLGISSPFVPTTMRFTSQGIMNPYHWQMFEFLQESDDAKTLFLYGDIYGQNAVLRNSYKAPYMVNFKDYLGALQNKTIKRFYLIALLGDHHGVHYAYRKSFFSYGYHAREVAEDYYKKERDICNFTYYVIDIVSSQQVIGQYNQLLREALLKNEFIEETYRNPVASILLNNKPGENCIPIGGIKIE